MIFILQVYERSCNKHILCILTAWSKQSHQNLIQISYGDGRKPNWDYFGSVTSISSVSSMLKAFTPVGALVADESSIMHHIFSLFMSIILPYNLVLVHLVLLIL